MDGTKYFNVNGQEIELTFTDVPLEAFNSVRPILSANTELEFECEVANPELLKKLIGGPCPEVDKMSLIGTMPHHVQIRRHRKKRINKKWNKKYGPLYGVRFKRVEIEDVTLTETTLEDGPNIFGFTARTIHI